LTVVLSTADLGGAVTNAPNAGVRFASLYPFSISPGPVRGRIRCGKER
jgi:hypothetical protein